MLKSTWNSFFMCFFVIFSVYWNKGYSFATEIQYEDGSFKGHKGVVVSQNKESIIMTVLWFEIACPLKTRVCLCI